MAGKTLGGRSLRSSCAESVVHLGLLLVVFGGFLLIGRGMFAADTDVIGLFGLLTMLTGLASGLFGLVGSGGEPR